MTETASPALARHLSQLLMHASDPRPIAPDLVTFEGPHGGYGVAVVVDGYYSAEDAADMVEFWRGCLRRTLDALPESDR